MSDLYDLPNGWEWNKLDNIGKVFSGSSAPQKEEYFIEGKYPFIRTKDLATYGRTNNLVDVNDYINDECINDSKLVLAKKGTTLFPKSGASIGTNNRAMIGFDSYIVSHLGAFYSDNEVTNRYIYNFFLTIDLLNYCENPSYPSLKICRVKEIDIPLPPLSEQQRIVSKLDNLFEKIDKAISLHQKNMDEANVFMGSVLNDVFGELEEKYPKSMINEISTVKGGKRVPKGYKLSEEETPYPYLRVTDFTNNGTISTEKMLYLSEDIYQQIRRYTITDEDLYITNVGNTIGKSGIIPSELNGANLTENAVKLVYKDKKNTSNKYMYYFTKSSVFISQMENATKQMAVPKLAIMRLGEITAPFPPLHIQQKVVKYLDEVSEKIEKVKQAQKEKMESLKALKASILDQVFRGEL